MSLDQSLNSALAKEKEAKKKMNATNARALNTMKQKIRKTMKEYEKEVKMLQEVSHYFTVRWLLDSDCKYFQDLEAFEREFAAPVVAPAASQATKKKTKVEFDEAGADDDFTTVGKGGKAMQYTSESIFQNLQLIQEARGKKVDFDHLCFASVCITRPHRIRTGLNKSGFWRNSSMLL